MVLSRANRSVRNFDYVVDALAGAAARRARITRVGYLYRTTAVYGSGKLGMADWERSGTGILISPALRRGNVHLFHAAQRLRQAEHIARHRAPATAVARTGAQALLRHRQLDGPGHGALPDQPSAAHQPLGRDARTGARPHRRRARRRRRAACRGCWTAPSAISGRPIPRTNGRPATTSAPSRTCRPCPAGWKARGWNPGIRCWSGRRAIAACRARNCSTAS